MWNLKYDTDDHICMKQKQNRWVVAKGEVVGERRTGSFGLADANDYI